MSSNHYTSAARVLLALGMEDYFNSFRREANGSWTCVAPVTMIHPKGRIQVTVGSVFQRGTNFMGVDLAAWLDEQMADKDGWKRQG